MWTSGSPRPVILGVKVFSDLPGQILGCSFYKALTNTGTHVVSLWDSSGRVLATQVATSETASGKQWVMFRSPVSIAANQTVSCGYSAPNGHFSYDLGAFALQKNVGVLHVPANGGVYEYSSQAITWPTGVYRGTSYWVDVLFSPSAGSTTWISGTNVSVTSTTANVTWNTAVPSDSQVEYGPTGAYGNSTALAADRATAHSVAVNGLSTGTSYHLRVKSRDSDGVLAAGGDRTISTIASALPVSISASPLNSTIASGGTQQFTATVSNSSNAAVTWSATTGTISSSGLFTAPKVNTQTSVSITANSQADTSKSATTNLTVSAPLPALAVNPMSLSFTGQTGASGLEPGSVSITNTGGGPLSFTEVSDQTWMSLSAGSGTAPSTLQVIPSMTGLKAGTYTGHISVTGGGTTKIVTVNLTVTSPPVQRSVGLSWRTSTSSGVVSYSVYRSSISGSSYGLMASAISDPAYVDQTVQSGNKYYYVVTAVNDRGQESAFSTQTSVIIP